MTIDRGAALRGLAFFGGGSGGHLYPGIAVAERARERFPLCRSVFFRTGRRVEDRVLTTSGFDTRLVAIAPPRGGPGAWLRYSMQSARAVESFGRELVEGRFDAAVGLGGYASLPGILAARRQGLPVVLLEQNEVPGKVNRLLAPFVNAVSCPNFGVADRLLGRREVTGNPVRRVVLDAAFQRERWHWASAVSSRPRRVLVVGGSQGARGINRAIIASLPALRDFRERTTWTHITGEADREEISREYGRQGWRAEVHSFVDDLPGLMGQSDLVIGRAGGTTLAEISVLGVPAVLVPYPHHRDQHQLHNAERLAAAGAAWVIEERALDAESLGRVFRELVFSPATLLSMEGGARRLAHPEAADRVLDLVLELRATCL